jgi:competence protein ComEC
VVPIALGLMLAPTGQRPDVLVGRGASLVAVRGPDGRLSALAGRSSGFELARWLEHDGDARPPAEAAKAAAFRCDSQGCITHVKGLRLAVAKSGAALRDDCTRAAILIAPFPKLARCRPAGAVIDIDDLATHGAHALTIAAGSVRISTVAETRGQRPWSTPTGGAGALALARDWEDEGTPAKRRRSR